MQNGIFLFFNSSIQFEFGMLSKRKEFSFDKVLFTNVFHRFSNLSAVEMS